MFPTRSLFDRFDSRKSRPVVQTFQLEAMVLLMDRLFKGRNEQAYVVNDEPTLLRTLSNLSLKLPGKEAFIIVHGEKNSTGLYLHHGHKGLQAYLFDSQSQDLDRPPVSIISSVRRFFPGTSFVLSNCSLHPAEAPDARELYTLEFLRFCRDQGQSFFAKYVRPEDCVAEPYNVSWLRHKSGGLPGLEARSASNNPSWYWQSLQEHQTYLENMLHFPPSFPAKPLHFVVQGETFRDLLIRLNFSPKVIVGFLEEPQYSLGRYHKLSRFSDASYRQLPPETSRKNFRMLFASWHFPLQKEDIRLCLETIKGDPALATFISNWIQAIGHSHCIASMDNHGYFSSDLLSAVATEQVSPALALSLNRFQLEYLSQTVIKKFSREICSMQGNSLDDFFNLEISQQYSMLGKRTHNLLEIGLITFVTAKEISNKRMKFLFGKHGVILLSEGQLNLEQAKAFTPAQLEFLVTTGFESARLNQLNFNDLQALSDEQLALLSQRKHALTLGHISLADARAMLPAALKRVLSRHCLAQIASGLLSADQLKNLDQEKLALLLSENGLELVKQDWLLLSQWEQLLLPLLTALASENGILALRQQWLAISELASLPEQSIVILLSDPGIQAIRAGAPLSVLKQLSPDKLAVMVRPDAWPILNRRLIRLADIQRLSVTHLNHLFSERGVFALQHRILTPDQAGLLSEHNLFRLLHCNALNAVQKKLAPITIFQDIDWNVADCLFQARGLDALRNKWISLTDALRLKPDVLNVMIKGDGMLALRRGALRIDDVLDKTVTEVQALIRAKTKSQPDFWSKQAKTNQAACSTLPGIDEDESIRPGW